MFHIASLGEGGLAVHLVQYKLGKSVICTINTQIRKTKTTHTAQKLLDSLYLIWYSTFWVKVRISPGCGSFFAAFLIFPVPSRERQSPDWRGV